MLKQKLDFFSKKIKKKYKIISVFKKDDVQTIKKALITNVNRLRGLSDVDSSSLNDGALLQYDASTDKFKTRNELDTTSGTLVFNGGNF